MMEIAPMPWLGWQCLRLRLGEIELRLPTEIGPRVLYAGFVDGPNLLGLIAEDIGQRGGEAHRLYGGHRLWHAPEHPERTYAPDNAPPQIRQDGAALILEQDTEARTGIQKTLRIEVNEAGDGFRLRHVLRNTTLWPLQLAPWALTVMAAGGVGILPLPPRGEHPRDLLPNTRLVFWPYSDLSDARWGWGRRHIRLRHDSTQSAPQKMGARVPAGWLAYAAHDCLFIKTFPYEDAAHYPDDGCNAEIFANNAFLELESLGPLSEIPPGASVTHVENWNFFRDVLAPQSDADFERDIRPRLVEMNLEPRRES